MNKQRREKIRQLKIQIDLIKTDLKKVSSELSSILNEEQDAFDNMPEGLQSSYRGMCSEDAIDLMDENGYEDLSVNSPDICGRISMSSVLIYPPGMPVVNVGERITDDVCRIINNAIDAGLEVPGLKEGKIRCLR